MSSPGACALAAATLDLPPQCDGHAQCDTSCVWCGTAIAAGTSARQWFDNGTFMDWSGMAIGHESPGQWLCGDCGALWSRPAMQRYTKAVACEEGLFPFRTLDEQAWFLAHPPAPPFLMVVSTTSNQQHIWWRAQVAQSRDVFPLTLGARQLWINRVALEGLPELVAAFRAGNAGRRMPFVTDLKDTDPNFGQIATPKPGKRFDWPDGLYQRLTALRYDDLWALTRLCLAKNPAKPEPIERS